MFEVKGLSGLVFDFRPGGSSSPPAAIPPQVVPPPSAFNYDLRFMEAMTTAKPTDPAVDERAVPEGNDQAPIEVLIYEGYDQATPIVFGDFGVDEPDPGDGEWTFVTSRRNTTKGVGLDPPIDPRAPIWPLPDGLRWFNHVAPKEILYPYHLPGGNGGKDRGLVQKDPHRKKRPIVLEVGPHWSQKSGNGLLDIKPKRIRMSLWEKKPVPRRRRVDPKRTGSAAPPREKGGWFSYKKPVDKHLSLIHI